MSASNAAAEPSMEEILSSIRQAINEDIPGAVPESPGDPFASGSSAEAAFSAPPPGQAFDATVHGSHDPFAELTRKLNETRESVQKQMHGVSSNLRSEQLGGASEEAPRAEAPAAPPPPVLAEEPALAPLAASAPSPAPAPIREELQSIRAANFSAAPQDVSPEETADAPAAAGALQALTARVADQQKTAAEPPEPAPAPAPDVAEAAPAKPVIEPPSIAEGTSKIHMPELSWASAERSAPTEPAPLEKPEFIKPAATDAPTAATPATVPAVKPKADADPFPKLTAMVERGLTETPGSVKTDDAMTDLVLRRILEPAIRSWLDDNLPDIVTEIVREEVRRVASQSN